MRRVGITLKVTAALAVVACVMAATAASAMAVSVEPLKTKFSTSSSEGVTFHGSEGNWGCEKMSISGTTNASKTNFIDAVPAFSTCSATIGASNFPITYNAKSCAKESSIPWRLTFNEGGKGNLQLICKLEFTIFGSCVMTAPEQTVENAFLWQNEGASTVKFRFEHATLKFNKATTACSLAGFTAVERWFSGGFSVAGIHVS